jgi:excisionase family DNA binding protein
MAALATSPRTGTSVVPDHCTEDGNEIADRTVVNSPFALLTPTEVAAILSVKLPRVYEAVKARRLRAVRVGRLLRFRLPDIELFLERYTTGKS